MSSDRALINRAATIALISTSVVVAVKLVAAYLSHSVSVLGEALQSTMDVGMSLLAVWSVRYAARPPDEGHPYGHGKAEYLASALQMVLVIFAGGIIVYQAIGRLAEPRQIEVGWGIAAMAFAVVADLGVIAYLRSVLRRVGSPMLQSEIVHLSVDSLTALGVLVGLGVVWLTDILILDAIIALAFVVIGFAQTARQLPRMIHPLLDGSLPEADLRRLERALDGHPEVRGYHNVRTRDAGDKRLVILHVTLDDELSFVRAHEIAEEIESELSAALDGAWVTAHYEPHRAELEHRQSHHPSG